LRRAPLLIAATVVLSLPVPMLGGARAIIALPFEIVLAGFFGTQRVWFARLYGGDSLNWRDLWPVTRSFIGRFVALGVAVAIVSTPVYVALPLVLLGSGMSLRAAIAVFIGYGLLLDVALTFVVPALALTTASVRVAGRVGLRMIRQTWPRCAWYAFTPGLTLAVLAQTFRPASSPPATTLVTIAATSTVALWFKGAIVAFYLRQNP
jgi:hypothetical protein